MKTLCVLLIRFYRKFLSPLKRTPSCRFTPTCSAYAIDAYLKRGFFVGTFLTVWRILRCNPFCAGGYDPVPEKGLFSRRVQARLEKALEDEPDNDTDSSQPDLK